MSNMINEIQPDYNSETGKLRNDEHCFRLLFFRTSKLIEHVCFVKTMMLILRTESRHNLHEKKNEIHHI